MTYKIDIFGDKPDNGDYTPADQPRSNDDQYQLQPLVTLDKIGYIQRRDTQYRADSHWQQRNEEIAYYQPRIKIPYGVTRNTVRHVHRQQQRRVPFKLENVIQHELRQKYDI